MTNNDFELLRDYAQKNSEDSFTELVRRHLDLVFSAALRQVRSEQLAQEVAQSVFTDLARNAPRLAPDTIITAWLYQVTRRTAIDVIRRESRRQLREQIAVEMNALQNAGAEWPQIEPLLDEAMQSLDETDRAAILLRYFENKPLREVGAALGISDDAAQKRVSRAVERLQDFLKQRGVGIGAAGFVALIAANAVQSASASLAIAISASALAGNTVATTTATATATKAIVMTTLQKIIIASSLATAAGVGIYGAHKASLLQNQIQQQRDEQAPLTSQIQQLTAERNDLTNRLALQVAENERLNHNNSELLKLRAQVSSLQKRNHDLAAANSSKTNSLPPGFTKGFGTLGDYVLAEATSNQGNKTPEDAVDTLIYALRMGDKSLLEKLRAPVGGGDQGVELFNTLQKSFTNFVGFHLSTKDASNGVYQFYIEGDPVPGQKGNGINQLNFSGYLKQQDGEWVMASPDGSSN